MDPTDPEAIAVLANAKKNEDKILKIQAGVRGFLVRKEVASSDPK